MPDTDSRKENRSSTWRWVVGLFALLAIVGAIMTAVSFKSSANRRLADATAVADRDDPYWRLDDLMAHREQVPDAENSARVLAQLRSLLPDNWPSGSMPLAGGQAPSPSPSRSRSDTEKAYDRLSMTSDNLRMDDASAAAIRADLKRNGGAVGIARSVADYPRGRHELKLGPALIDTLLPETQAARAVARLLSADSAIRAHDGDTEGAIDSCRAILGAGRSIGDEPFMISQLVRVAIGRTATNATRRVLGQGEPSDAALGRLQALILDERAQPLLLQCMRGERASIVEMIRRLGAGEISMSDLAGGSTDGSSAARAVAAPWTGLIIRNQEAVALEWMNDAVAISRRPTAEQAPQWDAWQANIKKVAGSRFGKLTATLPILLAPAVSSTSAAFVRYQADLGATAVLIAAERHRRKTGDWPASIAAIDRGILPSAPLDPFTGQAFRMDRRDGQLIIYSVGPNLKDERGAFDRRQGMRSGPDDVAAAAWDVSLRRRPPDPPEEAAGSR